MLWLLPLGLCAQPQEDGSELRELIRSHTRALGRVDVIRHLHSFVARGTLEEGITEAKMDVYKREGRLRLEIEEAGTRTILLYDGKDAWQWMARPQGKQVTRLNADMASWLAREAEFQSLLTTYERYGLEAVYLGRVTLEDGVEAYKISLTHPENSEAFAIYLSTRNYLEIRRDFRPEPGAEPLVSTFSDFRDCEGLMVPFEIVNDLGGQRVSSVRLEEVQINAGLPNFYFTCPRELKVVEQTELINK